MSRKQVVLLIGLLAALAAPGGTRADDESQVVEHGAFRLHLYQKPTGRETYEIRRDGDGMMLKAEYENTDRGTKEPLTAMLRLRGDGTPERFEVKGRTSRFTQIDSEVRVEGRTATVREGQKITRRPVPDRFFVAGGFGPVSVQMMLVRDWERQHVAGALETLPSGSVTIEKRGRDTVEVAGKRFELDRYRVGGVVWGLETLWFDRDRHLIAAITVDAEYNRFEAIREGFEPALPSFVAQAARDGMAVLAQLADRFSPKRPGPLAIRGETLIDGTGVAPVEDSVVIVEGDRIVAAGPGARIAIPPGARILEARGMALLPGLWEMHAHFTQVEWGPIYLAAGVTTARDCANEFEFIAAARDAIASARGLGPRLLPAGFIDGEGPKSIGVDTASTPEQALALTRRYADAGFPQIKIYSSLNPELVATIAREAHRRGMSLTGHIPDGMDLRSAVEAGMDQINHITYVTRNMREPGPEGSSKRSDSIDYARMAREIDPDSDRARQMIGFLKEHGTVIDPTLAIYELSLGARGRVPEPGLAKVAPELSGPLNSMGVPPDKERGAEALFRKYLQVLGSAFALFSKSFSRNDLEQIDR